MKTVKLLPGRADKEWIHFEIEADPQTQTFSIAANGEKRENLPFRYYTGDISKLTINAPKNGTGGIYVDNIILPGDEEYGKWIITALNDEFEETDQRVLSLLNLTQKQYPAFQYKREIKTDIVKAKYSVK